MRLIFIRHGDPDYDIDGLTEKGKREAALLAKRTASWRADKVYCSPLGRARETAAPCLEAMGKEAEVLGWLKEFNVTVDEFSGGRSEPFPWDFLPDEWTEDEKLLSYTDFYDSKLLAGTGFGNAAKYVCGEFDKLLEKHGYRRERNFYRAERPNDDTIVFFCHLGVSMLLEARLMNVSPAILWHGAFVAPTSVSIFASEERRGDSAYFRCQALGDTAHLLMGGEKISSSGYFTKAFQG